MTPSLPSEGKNLKRLGGKREEVIAAESKEGIRGPPFKVRLQKDETGREDATGGIHHRNREDDGTTLVTAEGNKGKNQAIRDAGV